MQTAANINLVLIDLSSKSGFADSQTAVSDDTSYLHVFVSEWAHAFQSRRAFQELTDKLLRVAEHAYCLRDMKTVQEAALILMNLPMDSARQVGQYYQALAFKKNAKKDEAQALLESVADRAPLTYRARAIQTLGTIHHEQGQLDDALRLYLEAARVALCKSPPDLLTNLMAHLQVSFIKSDVGDHRGALTHLENLLPLVRHAAKQSPFYFYVYQSDLAFELARVGRIAEAGASCEIAIASPFASAYPEWTETRDEIAAKRQSASPSFVAVNRAPEVEHSPQIEPQREPRRSRARLSIWLASEKASFQRASIVIVVSALVVHDGLAQSILDRVRTSIGPRAPPAVR